MTTDPEPSSADGGDLPSRMRASVAEAVTSGSARLRTMAPAAIVGLLSASALTPVLAATGGAGVGLAAGAGVVGSVGANVFTGVITRAIARLRTERGGEEPTVEQVREVIADRIATAFASADPADADLRDEVVALFGAVDVAAVALRAAARVQGTPLAPTIAGAFVELDATFGGFGRVLVASRLRLEAMSRDLRHEIARQHVDRERARRAEADIGRILDVLRDMRAPAMAPAARDRARPRWHTCPYQGLLPYAERHASIFYGRRATTGRLLDHLRGHLTAPGVAMVLGPSGSGKSSLLRAGLIAALADDRLVPGCRRWPRLVMAPTADPLLNLATHLGDLAGFDAISACRSVREEPDQAHLLAAQLLDRYTARTAVDGPVGDPPRLVLVIDQFEELFTLTRDQREQDAFLTALHAMATTAVPPHGQPAALVVAALRVDFLDRAAQFPPLRQVVEAGVFTVPAMSEAELVEVVTGPAAEAGRRVPADLVSVILDDLREHQVPTGFDTGVLPLLSQVMYVMWDEAATEELSVEGYRRTGGVADIVRATAERAYWELSEPHRAVAQRVFLQLASAADGRLTSRPATRDALRAAAACPEPDLEVVLEAFTSHRLLTSTGPDSVAIAHEQLLRSWGRLRDWLQPGLADQAVHRALVDDVAAWQAHGRDTSYLYHGEQLQAVRAATARWEAAPTFPLALDASAREFLVASERRHRRRRRTMQVIGAAMAVLLLVAVGSAIRAASSAAAAERSAARARQQHALALSRQLAAQSAAVRTSDWVTAQQLAAAAYRTAPTDEAAEAAGAVLSRDHTTIRQASAVRSVALSPDGRLLATVGRDTSVRVWDAGTGRSLGGSSTGPDGAALSVVFGADGRMLVVAGGGETPVRLWDVASGRPVGAALTSQSGTVRVAALSADGRKLATLSDDQTIRVWDVASGRPVGAALTSHSSTVRAVALSADGRIVAIGGDDRVVRLRDATSGHPVGAPLAGHAAAVLSVAFGPDGRLVAAGGDDGSVRLWDADSGRPTGATLIGHSGGVYAIALSPDDRLLATGGADGTARLWRPERFLDPVRSLCDRAGTISEVAWARYAAGEPYVDVCA